MNESLQTVNTLNMTQFILDQWFSNYGLCSTGGIWDSSGGSWGHQRFNTLFILIDDFSAYAQVMDI